MKYAVIKTGGKQYKISVGDIIDVELLSTDDKSILFNEVLLLVDDSTTVIGTPHIKGASVKASLLDNLKGDKIRVMRFKAKSRYRRVKGHRQPFSRIKIDAISFK